MNRLIISILLTVTSNLLFAQNSIPELKGDSTFEDTPHNKALIIRENIKQEISVMENDSAKVDALLDLSNLWFTMEPKAESFRFKPELGTNNDRILYNSERIKYINLSLEYTEEARRIANNIGYKKALNVAVDFLSYEKKYRNSLINENRRLTLIETEIKFLNEEQNKKIAFGLGGLLFLIVLVLIFLYIFIKRSNKKILKEKNRSEELLLNILPEETANELMNSGQVNPRKYALSTVLFTDFKEFTEIVDTISPDILVRSLDYYFQEFDRICANHDLEKIKTIGDAYMCVGGIPSPNDKNPIDVLKAAVAMLKFVMQPVPEGIEKFEIRIGIHTGPIIAGIVGIKKFQYDVWGSAVNIASLMETNSEPQKINISQNTFEYVKYEFNCIHRGQMEVKHGKKMDMYFVEV